MICMEIVFYNLGATWSLTHLKIPGRDHRGGTTAPFYQGGPAILVGRELVQG